ncbi:MAG TPA: hypothetical protein VIH80_01850 [Steroidobacteraceae bacterium]
MRWTIFKRRIGAQQLEGKLSAQCAQAFAQLHDFGAQHRILLARTVLAPPEKNAGEGQQQQRDLQQQRSKPQDERVGLEFTPKHVAGGYLLSCFDRT